MMTLRHYFEKELFADLHYHLDYDASQEVKALEGNSYQQYIHREELDFLSRKLIAQYYRPPFFRDIKHGYCRTEMTWLGVRIIDFLVNHNEKIRYQGADLEFNRYRPDLDLLQQIADAALSEEGATVRGGRFIASLPISPYDYHQAEGFYAETAVRAYADLASQMRVALLDQSIRNEVKNFRRNAIERCKHLKKVTHLVWEKRPSIHLIRLDWGYRKTAYHQPTYFTGQVDFEARMAQVNKYRQVMLSTLRAMFMSDLAFYAWKIEYSNTTGIHIHWLLGLDNSQNQALFNVGAQIQKAWDTAIANAQTYTFNLNEMSNAERSGLRVIDSQDPDRWEIVGRYVDYFLKGDHTLKLRTPKGMRTFGSSKAVTRLTRLAAFTQPYEVYKSPLRASAVLADNFSI